MKTDEILTLIADKDFLDKIYGYSYRRCATSYEAEDLCSEIIAAVITAIKNQESVDNFNAFVWTVARRVYSDFCEQRNKGSKTLSIENSELPLTAEESEIDKLTEDEDTAQKIKKILDEIAFLSKIYREVMILYYLDGLKVAQIAARLNISEESVKQRLFSARNTVRKEVNTMNNRNLSLKPVRLVMMGTGNPCGNDPTEEAKRTFSQSLIYLCKDKPKTAKELSEELCVPMPFIEEELEIQCYGQNGNYGMLRKTDKGKYVINTLVVDYSEYEKASDIFEKHLPEIVSGLKVLATENKEKILNFPYLSPQSNTSFILWTMISRIYWNFEGDIIKIIKEKYFSDVVPSSRPYSCAAIAFRDGENGEASGYGCDGINANSVGGYGLVNVSNIYGKRIDKHFGCGHNISQDPCILITIKAIGGLNINELTESEKETAAKAVECGYLRRNGEILEPKIIVIDISNEKDFYSLSNRLHDNMGEIKEKIAEELSAFIKKHIPKHLICDYQLYIQLIAGTRILDRVIEECIKTGLLKEPENRIGAEGVLMVVEK